MELQFSKWKIGLKIDDLYFLPSFCPNFWPFLQLSELLRAIYSRQSTFLYLFVCTTILSIQLWIYSVPHEKLASKLTILYYWPSLCPNFGPFCRFHSTYYLFMPCNVYFWYCFVRTTISSVHLWSYSVPNRKLASNLTIFTFDLHFVQILALF